MVADAPRNDTRTCLAKDYLARLESLAPRLLAEGFACGPDRWTNLHDLLLRLMAEGRLPEDVLALQPYLAPLFCRTPADQARFGQLFLRWAHEAHITPDQPEPDQKRIDNRRKGSAEVPRLPLWPFLVIALGLLGLAGGAFYYKSHPPIIVDNRTPPIKSSVSPPPSQPGTPLVMQPVPPRLPEEPRTLLPDSQSWLEVTHWLLLMAPGFLAMGWFARRYQSRRLVLRRDQDNSTDPLSSITLSGMDSDLFHAPAVRNALRRLHVPVRQPTTRLDAERTVDSTVRHAGLFSPVLQQRQVVPDVVVLVDFRHRADHMAGLADTVTQRLRQAGLEIHQYDYRGDPRRLQAAGSKGLPVGVEELASRHSGARMLLIGDPAALLDSWSGELLPWAACFQTWPERGLLFTHQPAGDWEEVLQRDGFSVAPLSSEGLILIGNSLTGAHRGPAVPVTPLPVLLSDNDVLLQPVGPDDETMESLSATLRDYLGGPGLLLLSAMAFYPALHWGLTRVLDLSLFPGEGSAPGRESRLLRVARLSWSRSGWLPDWLRKALLKQLTVSQRERIRKIYQGLFKTVAIDGTGTIRLPIAQPAAARTRWQRLCSRFAPRQRTLRQYLKDLVAVSPGNSAVQDRIFVNLLLGGHLGLLDFELPRWIDRFLPRRKLFSLLPTFFTVLVVATLGYWSAAELWDRWGRARLESAFMQRQVSQLAGIPVAIDAGAETQTFARSLMENLRRQGFASVTLDDEPKPGEYDRNQVLYGAGVAPEIAHYVAARLAYEMYLDPPPEMQTEPPESIRDDTIRVILRSPPVTGNRFRDRLVNELSSEDIQQLRAMSSVQTYIEPEMVEIPGGSFTMGCVSGQDCSDDEKPLREVVIQPFAIGRFEVTFDAFDRFAEAEGRELPDDRGWGRGRRPVINVSWETAQAYAAWLSEQTGRRYRLPSEAEWEYVARAGTKTAYWWGEAIDQDQRVWANCNGCGSQWDAEQTAPVGSFPANAFAVHDTAGNVWEWQQDCWHANYQGAPEDGTAWEDADGGTCTLRVVRGGAWYLTPEFLRSAYRLWSPADETDNYLGFRLARDL